MEHNQVVLKPFPMPLLLAYNLIALILPHTSSLVVICRDRLLPKSQLDMEHFHLIKRENALDRP